MTDEERETYLRASVAMAKPRAEYHRDRIKLLFRLLDAERAKSAEAERRGRTGIDAIFDVKDRDGSLYLHLKATPGFHFIISAPEDWAILAQALADFIRLNMEGAERRGRIAMREEAASCVEDCGGGAFSVYSAKRIRALPDDPPLTTPPGQTSPAPRIEP